MPLSKSAIRSLSTLDGINTEISSVELTKKNELKEAPKRKGFYNFIRWVVYKITCKHFPQNDNLDKATQKILNEVNKAKTLSPKEKSLIQRAFTKLLDIINKNGGACGQTLKDTYKKIKDLPAVQNLKDKKTQNTPPPVTVIIPNESIPQKEQKDITKPLPQIPQKKSRAELKEKNEEQPPKEEKEDVEDLRAPAADTNPVKPKLELQQAIQQEIFLLQDIIPPEVGILEPSQKIATPQFELKNVDPNIDLIDFSLDQQEPEKKVNPSPQPELPKAPDEPIKDVKPTAVKGHGKPLPKGLKDLLEGKATSLALDDLATYAYLLLDHENQETREKGLTIIVQSFQASSPILLTKQLIKNRETFAQLYSLFNEKTKSILLANAILGAFNALNFTSLFEAAKKDNREIWVLAGKELAKLRKSEKEGLTLKHFSNAGLLRSPSRYVTAIMEGVFSEDELENIFQDLFEYYFSQEDALENQKEFISFLDLQCLKSVDPLPIDQNNKKMWLNFIKALEHCEKNEHTKEVIDHVLKLIQDKNEDKIDDLSPEIMKRLSAGSYKDSPRISLEILIKAEKLREPEKELLLIELWQITKRKNTHEAMRQFAACFKDENKVPYADFIYLSNIIFKDKNKDEAQHIINFMYSLDSSSQRSFVLDAHIHTLLNTEDPLTYLQIISKLNHEDIISKIDTDWLEIRKWYQPGQKETIPLDLLFPYMVNFVKLAELCKKIFEAKDLRYYPLIFSHLEKEPWKALGLIGNYDPKLNNTIFKTWFSIINPETKQNKALYPECWRIFFSVSDANDKVKANNGVTDIPSIQAMPMELTKLFKIETINVLTKYSFFEKLTPLLQKYLLHYMRKASPQDLRKNLTNIHPHQLLVALLDDIADDPEMRIKNAETNLIDAILLEGEKSTALKRRIDQLIEYAKLLKNVNTAGMMDPKHKDFADAKLRDKRYQSAGNEFLEKLTKKPNLIS